MGIIPTIPNSNVPLVDPETRITPPWQRAFAALFSNSVQSSMVTVFVGAAAPRGWTQDTTVGLPSLPAGYIWIKKD